LIYRIDQRHFLTHFIDYFPLREITHMQYAIISAKIRNSGKLQNVVKLPDLYPEPEIIIAYEESKDKNILEKMYFNFLDPSAEDKERMKRGGSYFMYNIIYKSFINPLFQHNDIVIVCDEEENDIIDVFCKYLKKKFKVDVIDLNELFKTGHVGNIYIDRSEIECAVVDIRRQCAKDEMDSLSSTQDGRAQLISMMTKKEKLKKLRKYGIDPTDEDKKNIDSLLLTLWNDEMTEND